MVSSYSDEGFRSGLNRFSDRIPARVRGEVFGQKPIVAYSFDSNEIIANLIAIHDERSIVVQIDVAVRGRASHDFTKLSPRRVRKSKDILSQLRSKFVGFQASAIRVLRNKRQTFRVEGPFVPHQNGIALMTLVITVSRDTNFDIAYRKTQRFLELHKENDDRIRFARIESRTNHAKAETYSWSHEELTAIEQMARLEPMTHARDDDPSLETARRRYNEQLLRHCQATRNQSDDRTSKADATAHTLLREWLLG